MVSPKWLVTMVTIEHARARPTKTVATATTTAATTTTKAAAF